MIKTQLLFKICLPHQTKLYKPLSKLGTNEYNKEKKAYEWVFPLKNIKQALAILGKPVMINNEEAKLALNYSKLKPEQIKLPKMKGKGFTHVRISDDGTYFKVTTVRDRQPQTTNISLETCQALWKTIKKQPLNKRVHTPTIARNYCEELGITGFNIYEGKEFCFPYFSGKRKVYLVFYCALKVLQHYRIISHIAEASQSGVVRLKDNWELQKELT